MKKLLFATVAALTLPILASQAQAAQGTQVQITGEIIDTWCYVSEVMGGSEAVTGSAHHQCAVWCAAGGIPVGLLAEDGTVYFVLSLGGDDNSVSNEAVLDIQSHQITVDATLHERDGMKYLMVSKIVEDAGIVNINHEDFGVVPPFAVPKQ